MAGVSDNPGESQPEIPIAPPPRRLGDQSLEGAPESVPKESLCPEIVIDVKDNGGLGKKTGRDEPPPFVVRIDPSAGP
jgi:hypothetical protein